MTRLMLVSGLSGSGKSIALRTLEDHGFYCIDNLPPDLLVDGVRSLLGAEAGAPDAIAVGIDSRTRNDLADIPQWLSAVGRLGVAPHLLFLDCEDDVLFRRYADTRRRHPLSHHGLGLADAIALERQALRPLRQLADDIVDTSHSNVHQLRRELVERLKLGVDSAPALLFTSFAYRRGVPADADFVLDARVLPNPHWDPVLRPLSGRDPEVRAFLDAQPDVQRYLAQMRDFFDTWLPKLKDDSRSYVTVAFGCSGGRHRSVYLAESMAAHAREHGWPDTATHHRELD